MNRDGTVDDVLPDPLRLLFVGINPSLLSAATGHHFAHPGNRFYPALQRAGLVTSIDPGEASRQLAERGVGITNLAARATARADQLEAAELVAGQERLLGLVAERQPRVVAVAGITAFRTAFGQRKACAGRQPEPLGSSELWIVSNPSGLNAHATVDSLAAEYARVATAAGVA